jgi:hypothetical protein
MSEKVVSFQDVEIRGAREYLLLLVGCASHSESILKFLRGQWVERLHGLKHTKDGRHTRKSSGNRGPRR